MPDRSTHIDPAAEETLAPVELPQAPSAFSRGPASSPGPDEATASRPAASQTLVLRTPRRKETCLRARAAIRAWSVGLELPQEREQILLLLVSELVANALEHSSAGADVPIDIAVQLEGELLSASVTDGGNGFEPRVREPVDHHRGYGLFLVDQTASRWGVRKGQGTCVWFELDLSPGGEQLPDRG
jgi:anti-sigma regulatory factor (Ser/Thr protein kinase)